MKLAIPFLLLLLALGNTTGAQTLRLYMPEGKPAGSLAVLLTSVSNKVQLQLVTDADGSLPLPASATGYPYVASLRSSLYRIPDDTIYSRSNKVIMLTTRTVEGNELVVTGQYAPVSKDNAVQQIEVIDCKKIDAMGAQNLRDVLTNQMEIRLSQDPIFGVNMSMQGSKAYGADAKILIDGIPVIGKQNGTIDLSQINLDNIERIEIVKGPMSVSYGTDAIAGTVNLITRKKPAHKWQGGIGTYYESIGTYNVTANAGFRKGTHALLLNGARNFFGGWNPGDGPSFFNFKAKPADTTRSLIWKPREQYTASLQYTCTAGNATINYKFSYFREMILNRGIPMQPYNEMAIDNKFYTWRTDNAVFITKPVGHYHNVNFLLGYNSYKRLKTESAINLTNLNETTVPADEDTSKYSEINNRVILTSTSPGSKINYEAGYDINVQYANSTQLYNRTQQMGDYAAFGSMEYKPVDQLTIRPGVRYGYNTRYTVPLVPSVNILYKPGNKWSLRASYARGFRKPGLKELYFDFVDINHNIHGNTNLKAEYSDNYSAAISYSTQYKNVGYRLNGTVFYNDINNLITLAAIAGSTTNEYTYTNIGNYKTKGGQVSADITTSRLSLSIGGSYIGTYNVLSAEQSVPGFSYSPEVQGSITYKMSRYGVSVAAFYKYTGRSVTYIADTKNQPQQASSGSYQIADITCSRSFSKRLNLSVGCKNLFDVQNIVNTITTGQAHSSGNGTSAISTGRYYFVKTDINLFKS